MDSIFNIISTNISNHISDITDSTFSIIINGLIIILIILFFLAIKYDFAKKSPLIVPLSKMAGSVPLWFFWLEHENHYALDIIMTTGEAVMNFTKNNTDIYFSIIRSRWAIYGADITHCRLLGLVW